jgi:hypothetical protein
VRIPRTIALFAGARGPGQAGVRGLKRRRPPPQTPRGRGGGSARSGSGWGGGGAEHRQNTDVGAVRIGRHPRLPACHNFETVLQKGHAGPPDSNCTANPNAITPTESLSTMPGRPPLVEVACKTRRFPFGGRRKTRLPTPETPFFSWPLPAFPAPRGGHGRASLQDLQDVFFALRICNSFS